MANDKVYGECAGKIIKDTGIAKLAYVDVPDRDTGEKISKPVLKFSIANSNFQSKAGQYTNVEVWGDGEELALIEMTLAKWDVVTITNGTLKEGSYEGQNSTVKTMTITTYPNQIYIVDAKKDGKGLKYPIKKSADAEVADNSDMPF